MRIARFATALISLVYLALAFQAPAASGRENVPQEGLGKVHMPISCQHTVQAEFDRGLALLYSFWYDRALTVFDHVIAADPACQIGYWGAAMTYNHPLWAPPTHSDVRHALDYLRRGKSAREYSGVESRYFAAVNTLYGDGKPETKPQRDRAYMAAMSKIYTANPDDNAALFYSLSVMGVDGYESDPARISLAGRLAERVRTHQPDHPGALHYIIHAYDVNGYEDRALSAARAYAASAPAIPHALHMPSHTFVAMGLWQESIDTNTRALAAGAAATPGSKDFDYHGLWFLIYSHVQAGHYAQARRLASGALTQYLASLPRYHTMPQDEADQLFDLNEAAACIMSYSTDTHDYSMIAKLSDTGLYPAFEAARVETQVLGALNDRNLSAARRFRDVLGKLRGSAAFPRGHRYIAMAFEESNGSYALATGDSHSALASLRTAAAMEEQIGFVTQPTFLPPAHEMYARALLRLGQYPEAERQFRIALKDTPNRPLAWLGLSKAASALGDASTANAALAQFKRMWSTSDASAQKVAAAL